MISFYFSVEEDSSVGQTAVSYDDASIGSSKGQSRYVLAAEYMEQAGYIQDGRSMIELHLTEHGDAQLVLHRQDYHLGFDMWIVVSVCEEIIRQTGYVILKLCREKEFGIAENVNRFARRLISDRSGHIKGALLGAAEVVDVE